MAPPLGTHWLPERLFPSVIPARCAAEHSCRVLSGSFGVIRPIAVLQRPRRDEREASTVPGMLVRNIACNGKQIALDARLRYTGNLPYESIDTGRKLVRGRAIHGSLG